MSKRHPIDDLFRQHLANSSVQPPTYLWDRIVQERRRRRQRRIWMWSAPLSLIASMVIAVILWNPKPDLGNFAVAVVDHGPKAAASNLSANLSAIPGLTSSAPTSNTNSHETVNASINYISSSLTHSPTTLGTTSTVVTRTNESSLEDQLNRSVDNIPTLEGAVLVDATTEQLGSGEEGKGAEENRIAGPHQRERLAPVALLPLQEIAPQDGLDLNLFNSSHAPRCARFANQFLRFDVEVLGGPAYAHQQLQSRTVEGVNHLRDRQRTEFARTSFSSGIRLAATSNAGLGLRTGLMYTQINDRFEHFIGTTVDTIINYHYDPNGTIISSDTTWSSKTLMANKNNTLRFFEIPLLLTFERQWGKFRVAVNGGAYLNVHFDAKGEVLSPATGDPAPFGQTGDADVLPIFNQRATAAWYGSATLIYNLHSRYSLLIEPYVKSYPRALTNPDYDLQQNYWIAGLQAGVRVRL